MGRLRPGARSRWLFETRVRPASLVESVLRVSSEVEGVRKVDRRDLEAPDYTV